LKEDNHGQFQGTN